MNQPRAVPNQPPAVENQPDESEEPEDAPPLADEPANPEEPAIGPALPPPSPPQLAGQVEGVDDAVLPPQDPDELLEYFLNGGKPSCPQVMWDPLTADSQREPGLTPEAEAWQKAQRLLQDDLSVSATAMDSSPKQLEDVVHVSDSEAEAIAPRNLSHSLEAASSAAIEVSTPGLLVQKMFSNVLQRKVFIPFHSYPFHPVPFHSIVYRFEVPNDSQCSHGCFIFRLKVQRMRWRRATMSCVCRRNLPL